MQVAEEEYLLQELRKIEARKKEREKRSQDLQKLITAADTTAEQRRTERKAPKKKLPQKKEAEKPAVPETAGIKFPDFKSAGVTLRSQRVSYLMQYWALGSRWPNATALSLEQWERGLWTSGHGQA